MIDARFMGHAITWDALTHFQRDRLKGGDLSPMRVHIDREQMKLLSEAWPFENPAPPSNIDDLEWNSIHIEVS